MSVSAGWTTTWAAPPQPADPTALPQPFGGGDLVLADTTLRQTLRVSVGGTEVRLRLSNAFGAAPLTVSDVAVGLPHRGEAGSPRVTAGTVRPVSFHGNRSVVVPPGAPVVSDPVAIPVAALSTLSVTLYLPHGMPPTGVTSHPGSRTTSYLAPGNSATSYDWPDATPVDQWYLLTAIEIGQVGGGAVAVLGDSLTDGRGSTTNGNDRWIDLLAERLDAQHRAHLGSRPLAVVNAGLGGNRVLTDGVGPNALARLDRDVLAHSGVSSLIVLHGINDIGTAAATADAQARVAADLVAAYEQIILRAHARGVRVLGATLTPFGGNEQYDDSAGLRDRTRSTVNEWITGSGRFDAVIDFDRAVRDPSRKGRLLAEADEGDHLHLNPRGYALLADAVPLDSLSAGTR